MRSAIRHSMTFPHVARCGTRRLSFEQSGSQTYLSEVVQTCLGTVHESKLIHGVNGTS